MTDYRATITDPVLLQLVEAVDDFQVVIGVQDKMKDLLLRSYQAGRNRVAMDLAESDRKKEISQEFSAIRVKLEMLERAYIRQMSAPPEFLSREQVVGIVERVRDALEKQMKRNG